MGVVRREREYCINEVKALIGMEVIEKGGEDAPGNRQRDFIVR